MTWTPLITAADFTGIQTDISTAAAGLITIALVIVALGVLFKIFSR